MLKVVMPDDPDACCIYIGAKNHNGHGSIRCKNKRGHWSVRNAHTIVFEYFNGPLPEGHVVRHTCDVRACVNRRHLIGGTQKENIQDMIDRGREVMFTRAQPIEEPCPF